jgi:AcrR family transcriptional regulator
LFGTPTKQKNMKKDLRQVIVDAGLAILREQGLAGLTQPRVAARTGLRQSHLTYYYPTRADLVTAVAQAAVSIQQNAAKSLGDGVTSVEECATKMANVAMRHENTRVLAALNQAADQEPGVQALFNELTEGFLIELKTLLRKLKLPTKPAGADLLHAVFVGLSIIELATSRPNGKARSKAAFKLALDAIAGEQP